MLKQEGDYLCAYSRAAMITATWSLNQTNFWRKWDFYNFSLVYIHVYQGFELRDYLTYLKYYSTENYLHFLCKV